MKIIQILIGHNNSVWQNMLIGLGDNGNVYYHAKEHEKKHGNRWVLADIKLPVSTE